MKKLISSVTFLAVAPITGYVIQFLVLPLIILDLGINAWGNWNLGLAYCSIGLFVSEFGISTGFIARLNQGSTRAELIRLSLPHKLIVTLLTVVLLFVNYFLARNVLFLSGLVLLAGGVFNFDSILLSENRSYLIAIRELFNKAIAVISLLVFRLTNEELTPEYLFLSFLFGALFSMLVNLLTFRGEFIRLRLSDFGNMVHFWREFYLDALNSVSQLIQGRLPIVVVGYFGGVEMAGLWSVTEGLGRAALTPFGIIGHALFAVVPLSKHEIKNMKWSKIILLTSVFNIVLLFLFGAFKPLLEAYFHIHWEMTRYLAYFSFVSISALMLIFYNVIFSNYYSIRLTNISSLLGFLPSTLIFFVLYMCSMDLWITLSLALISYELSKPLMLKVISNDH